MERCPVKRNRRERSGKVAGDVDAGQRDRKCGCRETRAISGYARIFLCRPRRVASRRVASVCIERVCAEYRQGEPGCAMNYDRWAGELAAPLKSRLIYYYVLLLLFGYLYPYNIMPREIPASRRYVTARGSPGIGTSFSASVIT